ncbi:MAG TPA: ABC transporter ATP-binding protein [Planctomycetota bacterium]|nr:ABC transporter ATP-binding protein [Planctomycetota bacterium]
MQVEQALAVSCRGVKKTYVSGTTRTEALRGIDLDVFPSELLMLVGPSGCGKTTLISVIAGILDQDQGEALVFGRDFKAMGAREKTAWRGVHVGFVFQAFNLLPSLSARENVAVPLLILGEPRKRALERAQAVLAQVGLAERGDSLPSQLSGGQQQRVAIARALVHGPRLIVCDEPTSSLDHETGKTVIELLRQTAVAPDRALVIVTHDQRIFGYADRIARMDDGRITRIEKNGKVQ